MTEYKEKILFVTGGAGFIGSNYVRYAVNLGYRVINLDALTYAGNRNSLMGIPGDRHEFVEGRIGDSGLVKQLLNSYQPDAVLNFAAESHVDRSIDSPSEFIKTNILETVQLLENVLSWWRSSDKSKARSFRFLHVSTDEVYGSISNGCFTEQSAYQPNSPYAASKAASDHFVHAYHVTYGLPTNISNCSNNYGPYQFPEKLIPHIIASALEERRLPIYGDGLNVRDWLHVKDHCAALVEILRSGEPGETYNIGGGEEWTNIDVVHKICEILDNESPRSNGQPYQDLIEYVADRPGHDKRYAIDCNKIKSELGWRQSVNFSQGLKETVLWYLNNVEWWTPIRKSRYQGIRLGTR